MARGQRVGGNALNATVAAVHGDWAGAGSGIGQNGWEQVKFSGEVAGAVAGAYGATGIAKTAGRAAVGLAAAAARSNAVPRLSAVFNGGDGSLTAIKNMEKWSARHPEPGYYDVIGHGSPHDLAGMSAAELADKLRPGLGGRNVRLLSCQTACPSGSFAQDLANELGVRVQAPTTDIGASGSGKSFEFFKGGEWAWFDPN